MTSPTADAIDFQHGDTASGNAASEVCGMKPAGTLGRPIPNCNLLIFC